jgi:hypothetical protein
MIGFEAAIIAELDRKVWIEDDLFWSNDTNGVDIEVVQKPLYIIR